MSKTTTITKANGLMFWSWFWTRSKLRLKRFSPLHGGKTLCRDETSLSLLPSAPAVGDPLYARPLNQFGDVLILIQNQFQSSDFYRLTDRLSVTFVFFVQTAEHIIKLLYWSSSPIILVFFDSQRWFPISRQTPSAGKQNKRGWDNFTTFDWNRRISRKRYEIGP